MAKLRVNKLGIFSSKRRLNHAQIRMYPTPLSPPRHANIVKPSSSDRRINNVSGVSKSAPNKARLSPMVPGFFSFLIADRYIKRTHDKSKISEMRKSQDYAIPIN